MSAFYAYVLQNSNVTVQQSRYTLHEKKLSSFLNHPISFFSCRFNLHPSEGKQMFNFSRFKQWVWLIISLYNTNLHSSPTSLSLSSLLCHFSHSVCLSLSLSFSVVQSLKGRTNVFFHLPSILVSMPTRYESPHPLKIWTQSVKHVTINIAINQFIYSSHVAVRQPCSVWTAASVMWRWIKPCEHFNKASLCKNFSLKEMSLFFTWFKALSENRIWNHSLDVHVWLCNVYQYKRIDDIHVTSIPRNVRLNERS